MYNNFSKHEDIFHLTRYQACENAARTGKAKCYSPLFTVLVTSVSIFITAAVVLSILAAPPQDSAWRSLLTGSFLLALLLSPVLYLLVLRPLLRQNSELNTLQGVIEKAKKEWQDTFDSITEVITIHDTDFNIVRANRAASHKLGLSFREILGRKCYSAYHGKDEPPEFCPCFAVLKTGHPVTAEFFEPHMNCFVELKAMPRLDRNNNVIGMVHIVSDITDRKTAEQEIEKAREITESANNAKSWFLAHMSNEIRTPMNTIISTTEMVLDTNMDSTQREYMETIKQSSESLLFLLNDILDFSNVETGKLELNNDDLEIRTIIDNVTKAFVFKRMSMDVDIDYTVSPEVPAVLTGDELRIRQVLINLLSNAIKFTEKGWVRLSVRQAEDEQMLMQIKDEGNTQEIMLHFSVSDTGIGIPKAKHDLIFESFTQLGKDKTSRYSGSGLGLSIVKKLVELMGGKIWVESQEGKGAIMHFTARFGIAQQPSGHGGRDWCHS